METSNTKKIIFSGIQPSGTLTIGNYIGAIKNWLTMLDEFDCIYSIVDMHAITVAQDPAALRKSTLELCALYIACGLDPQKCTLFVQSHVPAHAELAWVLSTYTYLGELSRMTQFKDKSQKSGENINLALMAYPVLMAADILLYQANLVPVGVDQKQHLELSRDIAIRFNNRYSPTFAVPEPYIAKQGAKIFSLSDPTSKMSKSDENENGYISMTDDADAIVRKFRRAVTDSDTKIVFDAEKKAGVSNLLTIYSAFAHTSPVDAERHFSDKTYEDLKRQTADAVIAALAPIQAEQKRLLADKEYLGGILKQGAEKANYLARKTLSKVYRKIGFLQI